MTPRPPTLEALHCFTLGLRDALRPRLALVSILIWTLALVFWGVVLAVFHAEAAALVGQALSTLWSAAPSWMNPAVAVAQNPWVQGTVSFLLLMLGYWIVCLITVSLLMELMLMQRVQSVCLPRYPALSARAVDRLLRGGASGLGHGDASRRSAGQGIGHRCGPRWPSQ